MNDMPPRLTHAWDQALAASGQSLDLTIENLRTVMVNGEVPDFAVIDLAVEIMKTMRERTHGYHSVAGALAVAIKRLAEMKTP